MVNVRDLVEQLWVAVGILVIEDTQALIKKIQEYLLAQELYNQDVTEWQVAMNKLELLEKRGREPELCASVRRQLEAARLAHEEDLRRIKVMKAEAHVLVDQLKEAGVEPGAVEIPVDLQEAYKDLLRGHRWPAANIQQNNGGGRNGPRQQQPPQVAVPPAGPVAGTTNVGQAIMAAVAAGHAGGPVDKTSGN